MPILHGQMAGQGKTPDGSLVQVTPQVALQGRGPVFQVTITIEQNAARGLLAHGKSAASKTGMALIDTGASNTCVDDFAAKELGLPVIDIATMQSASHERHPCNIYPVQIITPVVTLSSPRTMGANLSSQGLLVLIGRDVLASCTLFYNGPAGEFTLSL
jgi:predicted aspartyl protease